METRNYFSQCQIELPFLFTFSKGMSNPLLFGIVFTVIYQQGFFPSAVYSFTSSVIISAIKPRAKNSAMLGFIIFFR
jgi:hypothetical protein